MMRSLVVVELNEKGKSCVMRIPRFELATALIPERRRSVDLDEPGFEVVVYDDVVAVALVTMPVAHLEEEEEDTLSWTWSEIRSRLVVVELLCTYELVHSHETE